MCQSLCRGQVPIVQKVQKIAEVPPTQFIDEVMDVPGVRRGLVSNIQSTEKTVEEPRVQFIDRVVDDPAVMQREAFNIEARELIEDDSVGLKQQGSERPLSPKKRRFPVETESGNHSGEQLYPDAESNHERFKDLVLPSPQSCLCVSIASSDEGGDEADGEEEELKQQEEATRLVQGGRLRA